MVSPPYVLTRVADTSRVGSSGRPSVSARRALKPAGRQSRILLALKTSHGSEHFREYRYGRGQEIVVVGAGPGGLLTACLLAQRGFQVHIFEKRPAPDQDEKHYGSRSIVFGLLARGQKGFQEAGIRLPSRDQKDSIWLNGLAFAKGAYRVQNKNGKIVTSFNALPPSVLFVERAALVDHMITEIGRLEPDRVKLHYGHSLSRIDFHNRTAVFVDSSGSELAKKYTFLVGSDGARSRVRGLLEEYDSSMTHEEHLSDRSYKGFHRLPAVDGVDLGDDSGIPLHFHLFGESVAFNAAFWPTRFGTVTGQISCPRTWFEDKPNTEKTYEDLFKTYYPNFPTQWIPEASKQLVAARAAPNGTSIRCTKLHGPSTVILGDAAHGVTPALGQGCNAALESAVILSKVLDSCQENLSSGAENFTKARISDVHALYQMDRSSRQMSGFSGKKNFLFLASRFHAILGMGLKKLFPFWFKGPAYMNMMGEISPYSQVLRALKRDRYIFGALLLCSLFLSLLAAKTALSKLTLKIS